MRSSHLPFKMDFRLRALSLSILMHTGSIETPHIFTSNKLPHKIKGTLFQNL